MDIEVHSTERIGAETASDSLYKMLTFLTVITMARPTAVSEVATHFGVSVTDLLLSCRYCSRDLTDREKTIFDASDFKVRWIENTPVGCCQVCVRLCGYLEFNLFFESNLLPEEILASTGRPLSEQVIRCKSCLGVLSKAEKERLEGTREYLYRVRGRLRSLCSVCRTAV